MHVLGLDFSGSAAQWSRRVTSNVWLAELGGRPARPRVVRLLPVQGLPPAPLVPGAAPAEPGTGGSAWDRLVALLARGGFDACGIDAPLALAGRVALGEHAAAALASADALDAVLAALAATALVDGRLHDPLPADAGEEGWIAVRG